MTHRTIRDIDPAFIVAAIALIAVVTAAAIINSFSNNNECKLKGGVARNQTYAGLEKNGSFTPQSRMVCRDAAGNVLMSW